MRDKIKETATEMLIRHGYQGLRFQQISEKLDITRSNVHYHFGNKQALVEEVIVDYTKRTLAAFQDIWTSEDTSLQAKILQTMNFNRGRYAAFNPTSKTGNPWSLIARMRLERDLLSGKGKGALADFGTKLDGYINAGVRTAVRKGELRADAPVEEIALQLVSIANSAGPITQDAGSFDRLEQLYLGFAKIVGHAYGTRTPPDDPAEALAFTGSARPARA